MKEKIGIIILIVWTILSSIYIGYDIIANNETNEVSNTNDLDEAYKSGMETTIDLIMKQGLDTGCKPIGISDGKKEINLINLACVQQPEEEILEENK